MWRDIRCVRFYVAVSCIFGTVLVALGLLFVWISKHVVDIATSSREGSLTTSCIIMAIVMLLQVLFGIASRYWEGYVVVKTTNKLRSEAFGKVMRSVWNGRDRFHSGDAVNRLEEDIRVLVDFITLTFPSLIVTAIQLVAASAFLFRLAPSLAWILVFIMPVAVIGSKLFFRRIRKVTNEIRAQDSVVQGHMQEHIQHRVMVTTLGAASYVREKLDALQSVLRKKTVKRLRYSAVAGGFMRMGFATGYALAFFWGVFGLRDGTVSYGLMVAFLQLVGQIQRPVAEIASCIPAFIRALSSEERLVELVEDGLDETGAETVIPEVLGVRVRNLSFTYEGAASAVFENMDIDFKPGTTTAIIGETGIGKSTLAKVIISLLKPCNGTVELYTGSGKVYPLSDSLRSNFQYVPQGNTLMSGTIRQNLLLAKPDATEEELRDVLELAAADFVFESPEGLDKSCSEVGVGLSEGQAQRIAVARALLRPGGILVLDEATSALDPQTERKLLSRICGRFRGSKTILCVTHRSAAGEFADSVLEMH